VVHLEEPLRDVAHGEQRFAPVEGEIGARRIPLVEPIERASEETRCQGEVVTRQRSAAGCREMARGALA
jgi:hypothetical protein